MMEAFMLYTLKSSLCLSAGYLLYYLLLKRDTFHRFKRFVILGIFFSALAVPLIKLQVDFGRMSSPEFKSGPVLSSVRPLEFLVQEPSQMRVSETDGKRFNYLSFIYLVGVSIQLFLIITALVRILLLLRNSEKKLFRGFRLALIPWAVAPFCFGRRIIISEQDFMENGKEVLLHEHSHMKQFHGLDLLLSELYLVMTWYNPASWLIRRELKQNHEFEADSHVLRQGIDEKEYQMLLVRKVVGESRFSLANQFNQSNIKTRITMMNKRKSSPGAILKVLLFIPLIAMMVQIFAQKVNKQAGEFSNEPTIGKYLELSPDQIELLGFEVHPSGLFYKNTRFGLSDKGVLCLYFTGKVNNASIFLLPGEKITDNSAPNRVLQRQALTTHDFYPVVVAHFNGFRNQDFSAAESNPNEKLLPVQINMAALHLDKRSDTLVFWFKPTASLNQVLAPIANMEDFIQVCPKEPAVSK